MIVLDASAAVSALLNDGHARRYLVDDPLHAPHLVDVEILSAMRRQVKVGRLPAERAHHALTVWKRLGLIRYAAAPLMDRVWELRESVTAYDAVYVALAENLGCALVTADVRLASAHGPRCPVVVVPN